MKKKYNINDPKQWKNIFTEIEQEKDVAIEKQSTINIRSSNINRTGQKWWQDIIKKRKKPHFSAEQRRAKSLQTKKQNASPEFKARMKEVYASKEFLEATTKANQNPERNKKISDAHSSIIETPDGVMTMQQAIKKYNITSGGIDYRIKTKSDWKYVKKKKISKETSDKIRKSIMKPESKLQKQKAMAEIYGYVYTPLGKFYSVREAHIYHCDHGDKEALRHQQYGGWFRYNSKHHPEKYYKKK